jgi:hypothetical protein
LLTNASIVLQDATTFGLLFGFRGGHAASFLSSMEVLMARQVIEQSRVAPVGSLLTFALGAAAFGAIAIGAIAIGAIAINRLAIDRVAIKRARFSKLEVDELTVRKLQVVENVGSAP